MKRFLGLLLGLLLWAFAFEAVAALRVVATTPDLAAVARAVGGPHANVTALALHSQDPHWVDAKPSLALDLARADLLLLTGADLELGWLPTLLTGSRNGKIQKGANGYLDCAGLVPLLDIPTTKVDRSQGDVHPQGNPHYMLDPRAVERVAVGIAKQMAALDPANKSAYLEQTKSFLKRLRGARAGWEKRLTRARGAEVIGYHKSLSYLADWLGLKLVDHVEPRPGIPPNPRHVAHLIELGRQRKVRAILQEWWFPTSTTRTVAEKVGARLVVIPGMPNFASGESYVAFMDSIVKRLEGAFGK